MIVNPKYPLFLLILVCFFGFQACSTQDDLDALRVAGTEKTVAAKKQLVPFQATFDITMETITGLPKPEGRITGTGNASHLGKTTFVTYFKYNLLTTPPYTVNGNTILTAANGDELHSTFTGTSEPIGNGLSLSYLYHTITGGTGRFQDARGHYTVTTYYKTFVPVPGSVNTAVSTIVGEIAY